MSIPAKNIVQIPSVNTQQTYGGMGISSPSTSPLSIVTWRQAKILRVWYETIFQTPNTKAFWFGSLQLSWNKSGTGSLPLQVLKIHGLFTSVHNAVVLQTSTCTKKVISSYSARIREKDLGRAIQCSRVLCACELVSRVEWVCVYCTTRVTLSMFCSAGEPYQKVTENNISPPHLSKDPSDLKQNATHNKNSFFGPFLHGLSWFFTFMSGMMHFVTTRVNFENYRSFRLAIVLLEFQPGRRWFLELKLAKKEDRITSSDHKNWTWEQGKGTVLS